MSILGSGNVGLYMGASSSSALYVSGTRTGQVRNEAGVGTTQDHINFSASRSSSVYGSSSTVTPLSESVVFCISY